MRGPEVINSKQSKLLKYIFTNFLKGSGITLVIYGIFSSISRISFLNHKVSSQLIAFVVLHPHLITDKFINDMGLMGLGLALYGIGFGHTIAYVDAGRYRLRSDGEG